MRPYVIKTQSGPHAAKWIAGTAIVVFCGTGIAAIMGWIPSSIGFGRDGQDAAARVELAQAAQQRGADRTGAAEAAPTPVAGPGATKALCADCGVIEATRPVNRRAESAGLPAVGGMTAGNDIERQAKATRSYEISVRMDDGSVRVIRQAKRPELRAGDHVKIVDGALLLDMGH